MQTRTVVESLLSKIPDISVPLRAAGVINEDRQFGSASHPELDNLLDSFNKPKVLVSIAFFSTVFIIEPTKIRRRYPCIIIHGETCTINDLAITQIIGEVGGCLNKRDYLPPAFLRQIAWFDEYNLSNRNGDQLKGIVFSEYLRNVWTIGDPLTLPAENSLKTNYSDIVSNLLKSMEG